MDERRTFAERPQHNAKTGCFLKGHVPFNKGKKWDEWMDGRKQRKVRRIATKNLRPRMDIGGWNKKKCVGVWEDGSFKVYSSMTSASEDTGAIRENIRRVCRGRCKRAGGVYWFYWEDDAWMEMVKRIEERKRAEQEKWEAERESREYRQMVKERTNKARKSVKR